MIVDSICLLVCFILFYYGYVGCIVIVGNLVFLFFLLDIRVGLVYEFFIYYLMEYILEIVFKFWLENVIVEGVMVWKY